MILVWFILLESCMGFVFCRDHNCRFCAVGLVRADLQGRAQGEEPLEDLHTEQWLQGRGCGETMQARLSSSELSMAGHSVSQ